MHAGHWDLWIFVVPSEAQITLYFLNIGLSVLYRQMPCVIVFSRCVLRENLSWLHWVHGVDVVCHTQLVRTNIYHMTCIQLKKKNGEAKLYRNGTERISESITPTAPIPFSSWNTRWWKLNFWIITRLLSDSLFNEISVTFREWETLVNLKLMLTGSFSEFRYKIILFWSTEGLLNIVGVWLLQHSWVYRDNSIPSWKGSLE